MNILSPFRSPSLLYWTSPQGGCAPFALPWIRHWLGEEPTGGQAQVVSQSPSSRQQVEKTAPAQLLDMYSPNQHTSTLQTRGQWSPHPHQRLATEVTDVLSPAIQRRLNLKTSMKKEEVSPSAACGAESLQGAFLTSGQAGNQGKIDA